MFLKNKNFICMDSFEELYKNITNTIPSTLLISENILLNNAEKLSKAIENVNIKWIIVIGENPSSLEEYLDNIIEEGYNNYLLDIITTSFQYKEAEDIVFEFLVISKLGAQEYQFISILNFNIPQELTILELINTEIGSQPS
ncbi:hypothetical protein [Neisseria musculi]|uniref:Uncharacterized protein n=1 Tax=Neisseria musculi TaxID=1815583 RepID=A0A7H1MBR7_9NEIS|nr:hypothetical protein [Neisseria musculi]QNT59082.1 hypothetical protein H7A79_0197 [Neisseria musculi]